MDIFHHFHSELLDLTPINEGRIVLVPKSETALTVTDFRPISVINLIPKLLSKVLANRLKQHMSSLVSEHQTAFLHGRYIAENFLATRELLHHIHHSKSPAILLKLNFMKAFDTLDWDFLANVMLTRGLPLKFTKWIQQLLTTSTSRIALNGRTSPPFQHKRGVRQGDPLSPYFFILAADVLQRMTETISTAIPYHLTTKLPQPIITLQYADDTMLLVSAKGTTIRSLWLLMHCFTTASGLEINLNKSTLIPFSIPDHQLQSIRAIIGCNHQNLPVTYLGMPLTLRAPKRHDFIPLLEKMEKRLEGWRARFLSRAGRLQLVKSVLSAIPTYYLSCFRFPKWLIARLDQIRRNFLWTRPGTQRPIHLINWTTATLPIKCGGLGIPNLHLQNISLLLRWWCRIFSHDQKLWRTYATRLYALQPNQHGPTILSNRGSFFWKSILSLRPLFHCCSQFNIASGRQISFWLDGWAGQPLLQTTSGHVPQRGISLYDARTCHHQLLQAPLTLYQHNAIQKLLSYTPSQDKDSLCWTISASGQFTVSSTYRILTQAGKTFSPVTAIWRAKVTPSMRCFFYFLLTGRLLTHDVLLRRNIAHNPGCVLCQQCPAETAMHLFFTCPYSAQIWANLSAAATYPILTVADSPILTYLRSTPTDRSHRNLWRTTFITTTSLLWRERNDRTFNLKHAPAAVLLGRIRHEVRMCSANC